MLRSLVMWLRRLHLPVNRLTRPVFSCLYYLHVAVRDSTERLLRFLWFEPLFRSRCARVGPGLQLEKLPYIVGAGRIILGAGVRLSGKSSIGFGNQTNANPELVIGDNAFIGHNCAFLIAESIRVGDRCLFAGGARVSDYDGHPIDADERGRNLPTPASQIRAVVIANDVWVGAGAHILKGVRIGERAIVGAGAVVTKDVPADTVVAGNPAKVVKTIERGPATT